MPDTETDVKLEPPYRFEFSENVAGYYGYKDGHVELEVKLPFPLSTVKKVFRQSFSADELKLLKVGVEKAVLWADLPDYQRERDGR
jgi:hypothetical protein